jgi:hypothetical protein
MKTTKLPELTERDLERFWAKVELGTLEECWLWTAPTGGSKYGLHYLTNTKKSHSAHRIAYYLGYNNDPIDQVVGVHYKKIIETFGISQPTLSQITTNKTWSTV